MAKQEWRNFELAREYVRALGLKNQKEWFDYCKSGDKPLDIPTAPNNVIDYKDKWKGFPDWLGIKRVSGTPPGGWRDFKLAREYVRALKLKSGEEWYDWAKSGDRPSDIPSCPSNIEDYKGEWKGLPDWLGIERRRGSPPGGWRDFELAREYVHTLSLKSEDEWSEWCQSGDKPSDIPFNPWNTIAYKGKWQGIPDWLGAKRVSGTPDGGWRDFDLAREYVHKLELKNSTEWRDWCKSEDRPVDIPTEPWTTESYKDKWRGLSDWLGVRLRWDYYSIVKFLEDIRPRLDSMSHMVLLDILRNQGICNAARQNTSDNKSLLRDIISLTKANNTEKLKDRIDSFINATEIDGDDATADGGVGEDLDLDESLSDTIIPPHDGSGVIASEEANLPSLNACAVLDTVDYAVRQYPGKDEESVAFILADAVGRLWRQYLHDETSIDINQFVAHLAGEYGAQVRERFLEQLHGARSLPLPEGYATPFVPNLMQKLIAYRLLTEKRLGNWSGTGAGKTLAAILASRVCDARLVVVVGLDNTIRHDKRGWAKEIRSAFPDSRVIIKQRGALTIDPTKPTFLLLNFESFQQPDSVAMVRRLIEAHQVDMIVLDEIQSAKQSVKIASKRRQTLLALLCAAQEKNPDLRVLGMSATPVINSLTEAKSLLEMIQGVEFPDLETTLSLTNIAAMYKALVLFGVRSIPRYSQGLREQIIALPGTHLADEVRRVGKGDILGMEQALLPAKIPTIVAETVRGTLIYTHYVDGIVDPLRGALEDAGLRVGVYTGQDDSGLDLFLAREVDVLIGSDTLMQGVDGLQKVSNRLIIATLPWTGAGYDQLIGRLHRQGSNFEQVDVIIPQVIIGDEGDEWSWDEQRHDRITFKKTVADAVVDGIIPQGQLESPLALLSRSREALEKWIKRLEQEGVGPSIERPLLRVPLPPAVIEEGRRFWGDFSEMNRHWATSLSSTTHQRLTENPTEWYQYHSLYCEARQEWPEIPYETIAKEIAARPDWVVGDFGCGQGGLARILGTHCVHSFDHVAINDRVTACDMAHTPLADNSLDVAVFSLSLMGTNWRDYIAEAYRVLKPYSWLRIAEPLKSEKCSELIDVITGVGFQVTRTSERGRFLFIEAYKL